MGLELIFYVLCYPEPMKRYEAYHIDCYTYESLVVTQNKLIDPFHPFEACFGGLEEYDFTPIRFANCLHDQEVILLTTINHGQTCYADSCEGADW